MRQDKGWEEAERRIEEARRSGAQSLDLRDFGLTDLPDSLGQLTQLEVLDLWNNQLTSLPDSLGYLTQLRELHLSGNQLTSLPDSLGHLTQLCALYLLANQLTSLPDSLGQLTQLRTLSLGANQLTSLPDSLRQLTQLRGLYLPSNELTSLPDSLGHLTQLAVLFLSGNQLTSLPDSLGQLTQLRSLNLSDNQLTLLPDSLGHLTQLRELYLYGNQLTSLPDSLGHLTQLDRLDLDENPLEPECAAAYADGIGALKQYLRAKAQAHLVLNEAKLVLVGEGEVGKSSLLAALRGDPWVENRATTHGVEIKPVDTVDPDSATQITLNAWDFGGQPTYRPTHQLFFTAPAVYLVVWKPRMGSDQSRVEDWIKMIKHRAYNDDRPDDRPRILVVATHGGPMERQAHIDQQALREQFGDLIVGFHHVDNKTGDGIPELKDTIARTASGIRQVGRTVPTSWKRVLDAVRERSESEPHITYRQYEELCRELSVDNELAAVYAAIMDELGYLIHYRDEVLLKETMILKADWLSKAISFVLDDPDVVKQNGLVKHDHLARIWNDPRRDPQDRYPAEMHPIFIRLLQRFDLSYKVALPDEAGKHDTSLIAQLVPGDRPNTWNAAWPIEPGAGDVERVQICRILDAEDGKPAAAEGILYRLIVRLHRYSLGREDYHQSCHWRNGIVLDDDYNGRALIEQIGGDIRVTVRAAYPERLLHFICEEVKWLTGNFWKGLNCTVSVPCLPPCKGILDIDRLLEAHRERRTQYPCNVCGRWIDIDSLLSKPAVMPDITVALAELKRGQEQILQGVHGMHADLCRLISQVDEEFDRVMRAMNDEARDGPRLFSLQPVDPGFFDKPKWISAKFRLTLWCEHSRLPLPALNGDRDKRGVYNLELPRKWLVKSAPVIRTLTGIMSLAAPVAASAIKMSMTDPAYKLIENDLDFGRQCADLLGKGGQGIDRLAKTDAPDWKEHSEPAFARDSVLRELHTFLKKKDAGFGGLVRVQNRRGEYLWVHERFPNEY